LARNLLINDIENRILNGDPLGPRIGKKEKEFLNEIQKICKYEILRQEKIHGFFVDGYIKELNIVIEFYESWHNNKKNIKKDEYREAYLKKKINCDLFIVRERDWLYNNKDVIKRFEKIIKKE
jgi:very-short-patch-repair endonuclease